MIDNPLEIPTLFETAVDARKPEEKGWDVIDHETWQQISKRLQLPEESRLDLVGLIRWARGDFSRHLHSQKLQPHNETRAQLKQIREAIEKANRLLGKMGTGAQSAVIMSVDEAFDESLPTDAYRPSFLERAGSKRIELLAADLRKIADRFDRAIEIEKSWARLRSM